ncbi:MAG: hypothetical protein GXP41_01830 [Chloroflexi bacterium]|nr:hypothetical protein [Chloroflexota bacterium]
MILLDSRKAARSGRLLETRNKSIVPCDLLAADHLWPHGRQHLTPFSSPAFGPEHWAKRPRDRAAQRKHSLAHR